MKYLLFVVFYLLSLQTIGQGLAGGQDSAAWTLDRMPKDLETDFALSALPPHVRAGATVYLLDPEKGYYVAHQGNNGFICFLVRTEWERGIFRQDLATAISYDTVGQITIFPVYRDVAAMRASGKFTALRIKDSITARYARGFYKAPSRQGISYMLAPIMRTYVGGDNNKHVGTFSMPHYMFYAPYMTESDIGGNSPSGGGPILLGDAKQPEGYIIIPVGVMEKAQMMADNAPLLRRLIAYRSYFDPGPAEMHH
jgi:hypothetical protein